MSPASGRPLTGRGVAVILVAAFGVVVGANATLAWYATSGFPGLVVGNSYVASQHFDGRRAAVEATGWRTEASWCDGALVLSVTDRSGIPARGLTVSARLGRPAGPLAEREIALLPRGGSYVGDIALAPGRWSAVFRLTGADGVPVELHGIVRAGRDD